MFALRLGKKQDISDWEVKKHVYTYVLKILSQYSNCIGSFEHIISLDRVIYMGIVYSIPG